MGGRNVYKVPFYFVFMPCPNTFTLGCYDSKMSYNFFNHEVLLKSVIGPLDSALLRAVF